MIIPYTNSIEKYLESSIIIDYTTNTIVDLAESLFAKSKDSLDYIKNAYEYVRDRISHSADAWEDAVTCSASEVLKAGTGFALLSLIFWRRYYVIKEFHVGFATRS